MSTKEHWMSYNVVKVITNINAAWEEVVSTYMNKVLWKLWLCT
jgi:hypothetical protein